MRFSRNPVILSCNFQSQYELMNFIFGNTLSFILAPRVEKLRTMTNS